MAEEGIQDQGLSLQHLSTASSEPAFGSHGDSSPVEIEQNYFS